MKCVQKYIVVVVAGMGLIACSNSGYQSGNVTDNLAEDQNNTQSDELYKAVKSDYKTWLIKFKNIKHLEPYFPRLYEENQLAWRKLVDIYSGFVADSDKASKNYSIFSSRTHIDVFNHQISVVKSKFYELMRFKEQTDTWLAGARDQMRQLKRIEAESYEILRYQDLYADYLGLFSYAESSNNRGKTRKKQAIFLAKAEALEESVILKANIKEQ